MVAKTLEAMKWEHTPGSNYLGRKDMEAAYEETSFGPGGIAIEDFADSNAWAKIGDETTITALMYRWDRACAMSQHHVVATNRPDYYQVWSQTNPDQFYTVNLEKGCTCPDFTRAPFGWCKHRLAAWIYQTWLDAQDEADRAEHAYYPTVADLSATVDRIEHLRQDLIAQVDTKKGRGTSARH